MEGMSAKKETLYLPTSSVSYIEFYRYIHSIAKKKKSKYMRTLE